MSPRRLRLLFATYGIAIGFLLPWIVPQLVDAGHSTEAIGLVLGISAFASLLAYPVWGLVADTLLGRDRTLMLTGVLAAAAGAGMIASASQPTLFAVFVVAAVTFAAPWAPVSDALALTELGDHPRAYGRLRIWTSVGWIGSVILAGVAYALFGPTPVRVLFVIGALGLTASLALGRQHGRLPRRPDRRTEERLSPRALRAALRASPVFLPFLGVLFVSSLATNAAYSFVSLRILEEGGGPILIGLASAAPAFVEIPVFGSIGRLADRWGLRVLFAAGCLISAVQVLVVAIAPVPAIIALVRLLDGAGFALRYSSIVLIAGAALPERLRATGQSMAWLITSGIAPIVSGPVGGLIYGSLGGAALFAACAALLVLASGLAWLVLEPLALGRRALATARPEPTET